MITGSRAIDLLPTRPTRAKKIVDPLEADDGLLVPVGYISDGASIPRVCWSVVGHPFEGLFIRPALDHDVRCELRVGRWQAVHDRFLETLRAEGLTGWRLRAMHRAVRWFGPRWSAADARSIDVACEILTAPLGPNGQPWGDYRRAA